MIKQKKVKKESTLMEVTPEHLNKVRKMAPIEIIVNIINLFVCIKTESYFYIGCSIYIFINALTRIIMVTGIEDKNEKTAPSVSEKKVYERCLWGSLSLSIISLGVLLCGILLFFLKSNVSNNLISIIVMLLSGINLLFILHYYMIIKDYAGILIKSYRSMNYSNLLINFALLVGVTLSISESKKTDQLVGMTCIVFGVGALALTVYILWQVLLTNEKNRNLYHHIRNNRTIIFTRISLRKDAVLVIGNIVLSFITMSGFVFANALYSAGMGIAKYIAIRDQKKDTNRQIHSYFEIGASIFAASLFYVIYSIRMFTKGESIKYNFNIALIIAAYTFTELFLIIKDYIKARKKKNIIYEEIKLIGLSSTLICLVLTQAAILSISYEGNATFFNGLSGVIFGNMAALIGVYMMVRSKVLKQKFPVTQDENSI